MDIAEQAQRNEALNFAQSLTAHHAIVNSTSRPRPSGYCLNAGCFAPFEAGSPRLFCGAQCASQHHQQTKHERQTRGTK